LICLSCSTAQLFSCSNTLIPPSPFFWAKNEEILPGLVRFFLPTTPKFGTLILRKHLFQGERNECGNKSHNHPAYSGIRLADVNPGAAEAEGNEKSKIGGFSLSLPIVDQGPKIEMN
jgi:hypothetical protein